MSPFSSYDGTRYLPNDELAKIYPEDVDYVQEYLRNKR